MLSDVYAVIYADCHLCRLSLMLSVTYIILMLSVVMLNVVMLSVVAPQQEDLIAPLSKRIVGS
jgi:hypothetical protein